MAPKRGAKRGRSPSPKRSKTDQNIVNKVKEVLKSLKDSDVEVPGPETNREMLISTASLALGVGSASDERHPFQTLVEKSISQVMNGHVKNCNAKVVAAKGAETEANQATGACQATVDEAKAKLEAKKSQIEECKQTLKTDKDGVSSAEKALKEARSEVENFDDIAAAKAKEREKYNDGLTVAFATLKAGEWPEPKDKKKLEQKYSTTVSKLLESCGADDSLSSCVPLALHRKPEERGSFDAKAIQKAEEKLKSHVAELDARLAKGPDLKKEKENEMAVAMAALETAEAKAKASEEALEKAEQEGTELSAALSEVKTSLKDSKKTLTEKNKELSAEIESQTDAKEKLAAFKFLAERLSTQTASFYWQIKGVKYDRELLNLCLKCEKDGVIDLEEAKKIIECAKDGQGITAIEKKTILYIIERGTCTVNPDAKEYLDAELKDLKVVADKEKAEADGAEVEHDDEMGELLEKAASRADL